MDASGFLPHCPHRLRRRERIRDEADRRSDESAGEHHVATPMTANNEPANHVTIFRTGKLWELDLARDTLKEHGIPFFARTDSVSGVMTALAAAPTPFPGVFWCILVPKRYSRRARELLRRCRLDVERIPLIWDFAPEMESKPFWTISTWIVLILGVILLTLTIILRHR